MRKLEIDTAEIDIKIFIIFSTEVSGKRILLKDNAVPLQYISEKNVIIKFCGENSSVLRKLLIIIPMQ